MKAFQILLFAGALTLSAFPGNGQSKAKISITREADGKTSTETREFELSDGQNIDSVLREMGVMNEFGELKPGQRFELQMQKSFEGVPEQTGTFRIGPGTFPFELFGDQTCAAPQPYLGVTMKDAEVPGKNEKAARITEVMAGSPAATSALREGDLITHIAEQRVESAQDVVMRIRLRKPGDELEVRYLRDGRRKKSKITLGERMAEAPQKWGPMPGPGIGMMPFLERGGFETKNTAFLGVTPGEETGERGVTVGSVIPGSCAEEAGIVTGDVILLFNGKEVNEFDELAAMISETEPGSQAEILIRRNGRDKLLMGTLGNRPASNRDDFRIFHDFRGLDDEGQMLYDFELDMDTLDIGHQFEELLEQLRENPMSGMEPLRQRINVSIEILDISEEEASAVNRLASPPLLRSNDLIPQALSFFPNPGNGILQLDLKTAEKGDLQVILYNSRGATVFEETIRDFEGRYSREIDFASHEAGTYFLQVLQNGKSFSRKVIKGQ
jgi:hypothetical protein